MERYRAGGGGSAWVRGGYRVLAIVTQRTLVGGWVGGEWGGVGGGCGRYRVAQADACLGAVWHWYRGTGSSSTVPRYRAVGVVPWVCGGYRVLAIVIQRTLVGGGGLWSVQGPVITLVYARYQLRVEPWNRGTRFHGAPTVHRRWILVLSEMPKSCRDVRSVHMLPRRTVQDLLVQAGVESLLDTPIFLIEVLFQGSQKLQRRAAAHLSCADVLVATNAACLSRDGLGRQRRARDELDAQPSRRSPGGWRSERAPRSCVRNLATR